MAVKAIQQQSEEGDEWLDKTGWSVGGASRYVVVVVVRCWIVELSCNVRVRRHVTLHIKENE